MEGEWVDFKIIKAAVTMQMVLDRYRLILKKSGSELRGKCPIHRGSDTKHFTANTSKNVFKCFFAQCGAHGNILDFVAAMERCSVREAAVKLKDWFRVGDTTEQSRHDDARIEETEINKGIYSDKQRIMYEVIGIASHAEPPDDSFVVYRELFGEFRFLVMRTKSFAALLGPSSHFTLVKKL
ncbi:MAG TPA: CHC2 zinc finger domain-containing protein [Pyrinomonadaceae bacterium]|nr:CHC2 zinc finger domain-containing protein [Pyrinomonadaceae bacterium]